MNKNHPYRCCVMAARNTGSITSCCSRKELETGAKNRPNLKHGQDVFIDVNSTALLNLVSPQGNICRRYHYGKLTFAREAVDIYVM